MREARAGARVATGPTNLSPEVMAGPGPSHLTPALERIRQAWEQLVNLNVQGTGPWEAQHDHVLGWCVKQSRVAGVRPIVGMQTKREATAVAAALNAVARLAS